MMKGGGWGENVGKLEEYIKKSSECSCRKSRSRNQNIIMYVPSTCCETKTTSATCRDISSGCFAVYVLITSTWMMSGKKTKQKKQRYKSFQNTSASSLNWMEVNHCRKELFHCIATRWSSRLKKRRHCFKLTGSVMTLLVVDILSQCTDPPSALIPKKNNATC